MGYHVASVGRGLAGPVGASTLERMGDRPVFAGLMMRSPRITRIVQAALLAALAACASPPPASDAVRSGERVELTLLGTTDLHGRLLPWDYYRGEEADRGLARVATLVDSIRAADDHVVLLDSGDLLQGNPLDYVFGVLEPADVHPVIRAMNRLGYDAAVPGNHEFNYGLDALERALGDAAFPFLAANVFVAGTDSLAWPAYAVVERGGVRIGILGLTTPGAAIWDRHNLEGRLEFRDIVASAERAWPELEAASDVQVVIMHSGLGPGSSYDEAATGVPEENAGRRLARVLPGIEVVFLGHTHRDVPSETVEGVLFTQASKWGEALAVARLVVERTDGGWTVVDRQARTIPAAGVPPDPGLVEALRPYHERTLAYVADTIGWTPVAWSSRSARLVDTPIVDLIHRVQLDATGADLSAASAFTTDATLGPGPITVADAAELYVYDNTLKVVRITGRQLREYLEYSAKYFHRTDPSGALVDADDDDLEVDSIPGYNYDMVAGAAYAIDVSRPVGERIVDLTIGGEPVDDDATYTLAVNNYRQGGGGGFTMIAEAPFVEDRQLEVRQLLIEWIAERDTIRPDDVHEPNWRIVPPDAVARHVVDASGLRPGRAAADSATVETWLGREGERIEGEARSRIDDVFPPGVASLPGPLPPDDDRIRLAVLATNDFHGALLPATPAWAGGDTIGGAANVAAYVRAVEARHPGRVLHLDGGDVMQGTVISNLTAGRSTVEVFDALGVDAAAIGNHEFDWSADTLRARIEQARFPWLSANLFLEETGERPEWVEPVAWFERGGLSVAVIGASTVDTPTTTMPAHVEPYVFRDIAGVVNELVPGLREEGADVVILIAHAGAIARGESGPVGEIVDAVRRFDVPVDLVVSGHTHTRIAEEIDGVPVVQAGSSGSNLGVVTLTFDPTEGKVVDRSIDLVTVRAKDVRPDPGIADLVARWADTVDEIADRPIATLAHALRRNRGEESVLGDLIADAQRTRTGADVAIMNGGGIRTDLPAGPVTYRDVFAVQPFQNTLVRMEVTAAELKSALEDAVADRVGQVSGIRFAYDPTRPHGERVRSAELEGTGGPVVEDGEVVDPGRTFVLTVNNFMASGGSDYDALERVESAVNTGLIDSEVLADHLAGLPQPVEYEIAGRITRLAEWPETSR